VNRRRSVRALRRGAALVAAAGLLAGPVLAEEKTDVLILENGDRLTGELKTLERGELRFKTDATGTLNLDWARVRSVESRNSFDVEIEDGHRYFGSIEASEGSRSLIVEGEESTELSMDRVVRIRRIRSSFWDRLDGSLALGLNFSSASSDLQLNLAADARIRRINVERSLSASWIDTTKSDAERTTRSELSWNQSHLLKRRRLLFLAAKLQRNDELGIDARGLVMAGYGRRFVQTNRSRVSGALGLAANFENTIDVDNSGREESTEGLVAVQYEYFRTVGLDRDITFEATYFPSLDGSSRYRLDARGSVYFEMVKDFGLRLDLTDSYDSRPPAGVESRNDLAAVVSVVWSY
jgi:putative salt-induced outer membrane protein YdiY